MNKLLKTIFSLLVLVFLVTISLIFFPTARDFIGNIYYITIGLLLFILGSMLIFFTVREGVSGKMRSALLITGSAAATITISVVIHNLLYSLMIATNAAGNLTYLIKLISAGFFFISTVIGPAVFVFGTISAIVLMFRGK